MARSTLPALEQVDDRPASLPSVDDEKEKETPWVMHYAPAPWGGWEILDDRS